MALPIRTTMDDVNEVCEYLAKKPTGATPAEMKKILNPKRVDGRKISALKFWGVIEETKGGKLKLATGARDCAKPKTEAMKTALARIIRRIKPYNAIIEKAHHRKEAAISATDAAAYWHDNFSAEAGSSDKTLTDQAVCFFQLAQGAALGQLIIGRKGAVTRLEFDQNAVSHYVNGASSETTDDEESKTSDPIPDNGGATGGSESSQTLHVSTKPLGQGIFIAHGKNKKPLEQLKIILDQFKVPYKVATDEPHLGRPISQKVRETMEACNCAILIFTADEELKNKEGATIWRPSENVVYELGAAGYLYDKGIVILKEDRVSFPSNFRDLGYITFVEDQLEAKAMDVLKELIAFGIVKVSTQ